MEYRNVGYQNFTLFHSSSFPVLKKMLNSRLAIIIISLVKITELRSYVEAINEVAVAVGSGASIVGIGYIPVLCRDFVVWIFVFKLI